MTAASGRRARAWSSPAQAVGGLVHLVAGLLQQVPEHVAGVVIVLDDEDPAPDPGAAGTRGRVGRVAGGRAEREADREHAAPAGSFARRLDAAAVQVDEPLHQGEADAEPRRRPVEPGLALHEQVEDPRQEIGGDAGAGVLHAEHGQAVPASRRRPSPGRPPA